MKKTRFIVILIALALIISLAYIMYSDLKSDYMLRNLMTDGVSVAVSDFTVKNSEEKDIKFSSLSGKPVIVNLWATWCPFCMEELPDFQIAFDKYKDEVTFLMVNVTDGQRETIEKASGFIKSSGYTFPVYYDVYLEASSVFGAGSLPMTFFIDKDGNAVAFARGKIGIEDIEAGIGIILKK